MPTAYYKIMFLNMLERILYFMVFIEKFKGFFILQIFTLLFQL